MKKMIAAVLLLVTTIAFSQNDPAQINNYKYVVVPTKFSFLKEKDQYQLNTFTKMFFEKYNFTVYYDSDQLPLDAVNDGCNTLYADLTTQSNMFQTRINVVLRDCRNIVVYTSEDGISRDKDFKKSYREALREAFKSFDTFNYVYNGTSAKTTAAVDTKKSTTPATVKKTTEVVVDKNTLFAQPNENGYQLVDSTPKIVYKLKKTSSADVFLAEKGEYTGTLIRKDDGKWIFEYYVDGKLMTEIVSIKF